MKTEYVQTDVYSTVTCPEVVVTTISEGHTVKVTQTNTSVPHQHHFHSSCQILTFPLRITKYYTDLKTVKTLIPVTVTDVVDHTVTKGSEATVTEYDTTVIKATTTAISEVSLPPATTVIPVTSTSTPPPAPQTTSSIITAGANSNYRPMGVLAAGVLGVIAML